MIKFVNSVTFVMLLFMTCGLYMSNLQRANADTYGQACPQSDPHVNVDNSSSCPSPPNGQGAVYFADSGAEYCGTGPSTSSGRPTCCSYEKWNAFCTIGDTPEGFTGKFEGSSINYSCVSNHCVAMDPADGA